MAPPVSILNWHPEAPRFAVFGLPLVPLTLAHVFVLERLESPVLDSGVVKVEDLLLATFVCSEPAAEAPRNLSAWWRPIFLRLWTRKFIKLPLPQQAELFREYIRHWTASPNVIGNGQGKTEFGSGWHHRLLVMLTGECGFPPEFALSLPVRDANVMVAALGESRGVLKLWNKRQESLWQFAREMDAKKAAAKAAAATEKRN